MKEVPRLSRRALEREAKERDAASVPVHIDGFSRAEALLNAVVPQNNVEGYVREISRLWKEAAAKFLAIGDYLVIAKRQLPHGEYEAMIRSKLPFSKSAAHRMRTVAEAVRDGRLARDRLPRSYATAYELTLLSQQQLHLAETRGLLRPDVYLSAIKAFRREMESKAAADGRESELLREWRYLGTEITRLGERLRQAKARRQEIENEIGPEIDRLPQQKKARLIEGQVEPVVNVVKL
jgi:predicted DNA-binding ArsR family transcriptional regulator